ncbi:hypothetical protein FOZ60_012616 [Perkinsus olseni]|uniref:Uncharacterized protein n=2 Tax=Perkinsus olseni TaxID=32597 RepID=A0A7J6NB06_PEROL|nr:hypothetical protein FOZ60_012616 [Perkinsus olseni]
MINQPVGQKRLTNIAIVSMKKKCKKKEYKFEIACYPNKVVNSRQGIETDLDEVLQSEAVYTNVSRGDRALAKDLKACFGTADQKEICKEILMHGTLQITGTEREFFYESRTNEIVTQLAEMCIDSRTGYPLTKDQISSALQEVNFQVRVGTQTMTALNKGKKEVNEAKVQAREAMKALEEKMPDRIVRASMRVRIVHPGDDDKFDNFLAEVKEILNSEGETSPVFGKVDSVCQDADRHILQVTCHPSLYRPIDQLCKKEYPKGSKSAVTTQIVSSRVTGPEAALRPVASRRGAAASNPRSSSPESSVGSNAAPTVGRKGPQCRTCNVQQFDSTKEFREHVKSEWHLINMKRELKHLPPLDHLEFEMLPPEVRENFKAVDS